MRYLKGLLLPALLALASTAAAKEDAPLVETTAFSNEIVNLMYFDDSGVALLQELDTGNIWRSHDAGKGWAKLKNIKGLGILKNPYDNKVALILSEDEHWVTFDQGETWDSFKTELPPSPNGPVGWHAQDSKKIMIHEIENCFTAPCLGRTFYTEDGFKSAPKLLVEDRRLCQWAKGSERFLQGKDTHDKRILCITRGKYSDRSKDFRLLISDDYFNNEQEPVMSSGRTVQGMANMAAVKGYLVAAAKSDHSSELALYVTQDTDTWHHAEFGDHKIEEDAYTILESTNYSIQVDVMTSKYVAMGNLYTSNSNGTYFTRNVEHTNRNMDGYVDFEKIANIQGVVLVNTVDNWEEVEKKGQGKKLKSRISFDDGRSFEKLTIKNKKDSELHLHSVTNLHNSGRVFSSPAPGIVMGVGNTGDYLGKYTDGDLYVSDDAGLTWELALTDAHKYEFGDQGSVLVAVFDEGDTDEIRYSLKHGKPDTWNKIKLDSKIRARELTTLPDSTSLKFMLYAVRKKKEGGREHIIIHLDFNELHERKCGEKDFENKWSVRTEADGNPSCVMGHKQLFRRRKWDADCFVGDVFNDPVPSFEPCDCDESRDYECDFNFKPTGQGKDKKCEPSDSLKLPKGACEGDAKTYKGSSGWRKIPGNQCKGETSRDKEKERQCDDADRPQPKNDKITSEITRFKGSSFLEQYYLERNSQGSNDTGSDRDNDETIVMLTDERTAWITHDHGKKWKKAIDDEIVRIYPHQYENNYVYFLTASKKVYYSEDRGLKDSIHSFEAPTMPNREMLQIMQFHPKEKGWLIWMGGKNCEKIGSKDCHTVAYVSQKNGQEESWDPLVPYVKKCAFVWREAGRNVKEEQVFCEQHSNEEMGAPLELISSDDWFKTLDPKFKGVVEFAMMSEFIIVATKGEGNTLKLDASLDANTFADAKFPPKFFDIHQTAYTVLDSSTHAVFLHVTVNPRPDQEYGSIIKSNSNGTFYVMSLNAVNRNTDGYVDFEKMQGLEGVALANVVINVDEVNNGAKKRKQSRITHNDGAAWESLQAPQVDSDNKAYDCDVADKSKCSLHIHGYTERADPREMYSSPTAVGLMLGVGNVGSELSTFGEANTFMTTDAGLNWIEVKKGTYAWEFGDQGSVIVIVRRGEDTDHLYYTLDSGNKWNLYKFSDHKIRVDAITTVPSDTSLNFLLWGKDSKELVAVNVDFSGLAEFEKQCKLDERDPTQGDYELWSPQHPLQEDHPECLFGHVAQYHRKKREASCRNGERIDHMHNIARNCSCTRRDYECAYNYERQAGGECELIPGLTLADPKAVCEQGAREWWDNTPYRKIPLSTCDGGKQFDQTGEVHACPGFEEEFEKKHGISGFGLFLAIVLPFLAAGGIGFYVWRNWDGKFGRIRLGDSGGGGFDSEAPWIKWPVVVISGLVAVVAAIPMLVGSLWSFAASRMGGGYGGRTYTSRDSFARGRGDYAAMDPDEGELLGEDSDEDV